MDLEIVSNHIIKGDTKKALELLMETINTSYPTRYSEIVLLQTNWNNIVQKERNNLLSREYSDMIKNQINYSILTLAKDLKTRKNQKIKITNLKKLNYKKNFLIAIFLFVSLISIGFLYKKITQANEYERRLIKETEFIKELKFKHKTIMSELAGVKDKIPKYEELIEKYSDYHKEQISAIQNGDLSYNSKIIKEIKALADNYQLKSVISLLDAQITSIENLSTTTIKNNTRQNEENRALLVELKRKKEIIQKLDNKFQNLVVFQEKREAKFNAKVIMLEKDYKKKEEQIESSYAVFQTKMEEEFKRKIEDIEAIHKKELFAIEQINEKWNLFNDIYILNSLRPTSLGSENPFHGNRSKVSRSINGAIVKRAINQSSSLKNILNKTGRVNIKICIDEKGNIIGEPIPVLGDSSTLDLQLIEIAVKDIRKIEFINGTLKKECGNIIYDFIKKKERKR